MIAIAVIDAVDVVGVIDVAIVAIDVVDIVVGLFSVRGSGFGFSRSQFTYRTEFYICIRTFLELFYTSIRKVLELSWK